MSRNELEGNAVRDRQDRPRVEIDVVDQRAVADAGHEQHVARPVVGDLEHPGPEVLVVVEDGLGRIVDRPGHVPGGRHGGAEPAADQAAVVLGGAESLAIAAEPAQPVGEIEGHAAVDPVLGRQGRMSAIVVDQREGVAQRHQPVVAHGDVVRRQRGETDRRHGLQLVGEMLPAQLQRIEGGDPAMPRAPKPQDVPCDVETRAPLASSR